MTVRNRALIFFFRAPHSFLGTLVRRATLLVAFASPGASFAANIDDCLPMRPMAGWEVEREISGHELRGYSFNTKAAWNERLHSNGVTEFRNARGELTMGRWRRSDGAICFSYGTMTEWTCKSVHRAQPTCDLFRYALIDERGKPTSAILESLDLTAESHDEDRDNSSEPVQSRSVELKRNGSENRADRPEKRKRPENAGGTGTGFVVDAKGWILTNAHVVLGCGSITVGDGIAAKVGAIDEDLDLAVVKTLGVPWPATAQFAAKPARLNSDVTVIGYPLHGLLGGINVTRGAVSSGKGLGGRIAEFQISAAIQPGNSGGPVLDANGAIVGVVRSKLDAIKVAGAIGDIPQNINFAVRGEAAKMFMVANGIDFDLTTRTERVAAPDLAETAEDFTVLISCKR